MCYARILESFNLYVVVNSMNTTYCLISRCYSVLHSTCYQLLWLTTLLENNANCYLKIICVTGCTMLIICVLWNAVRKIVHFVVVLGNWINQWSHAWGRWETLFGDSNKGNYSVNVLTDTSIKILERYTYNIFSILVASVCVAVFTMKHQCSSDLYC